MKIHQGSDFHLEFGRDNLAVPGGADVLILNGDIIVVNDVRRYLTGLRNIAIKHKRKHDRYEKFFRECSENYPEVIYVVGNHEHYYFNFHETVLFLKAWFEKLGLKNIHVLENESMVIKGVRFFGATLWTDMRKSDPLVMWDVKRGMNDFQCIQYRDDCAGMCGTSPPKFLPQDAVREHDWTLKKLRETLSLDEPTVVITHHSPSYQSIPYEYKVDMLSYAYSSDLDYLIGMSENILVWFHGHTHTPFNYKIGESSIICNPRGYYSEGTKKRIRKYLMTDLTLDIPTKEKE